MEAPVNRVLTLALFCLLLSDLSIISSSASFTESPKALKIDFILYPVNYAGFDGFGWGSTWMMSRSPPPSTPKLDITSFMSNHIKLRLTDIHLNLT